MGNDSNQAQARINALLDDNSFVELQSLVTSRNTDFNLDAKKEPSDGVIIGHGLVDGTLVFVFSQNADVLGGTIGEMHAKKILSVYDMALKVGAPVIGFIDCAGVRLQESFDALEALGSVIERAADVKGVIPQLICVAGNCGGGLSVLPALADFTFMVDGASLFLNSPDAITGN
ncbi:MAG: carboxyl transferase, partial [Pseudobutyrivibrio sp.]|nr:carboxyl transferase [Pseudobutyrivibrio sp.]